MVYYLKDHRQSEVLPFDTPELINLLPKADPFLVSVFQGADVPDIVKQPRTCTHAHTHIPTDRPSSLFSPPLRCCVLEDIDLFYIVIQTVGGNGSPQLLPPVRRYEAHGTGQ